MPLAPIVFESVSVVLRGAFNPAIFQPRWFSAQELISDQDAEAAKVELIHPEVCVLSTGQFELQVTLDRFMASTSDAAFLDPLRDLVLGTFLILRHTPLRAMGLNASVHLRASSADEWHSIGHRLAPKEFWEPVLPQAGMMAVAMTAPRSDGYAGSVNVRVEPSGQVPHGVFIDVNDHFDLAQGGQADGALAMTAAIEGEWSASRERATRLIEHIRSAVK